MVKIMSKYKIEYGLESGASLSTTKRFDSAEEVRECIETIPSGIWLVLEYAKTGQRILERDYMGSGYSYNSGIKCPKVLQNLDKSLEKKEKSYSVEKVSGEGTEDMLVDDDWMEDIPRKGIVKMTLSKDGLGDVLIVDYASKKRMAYRVIHGHWDNGTRLV